MRLIDADEINKETWRVVIMGETVSVISRKDIDNAPTVQAIPIEFIKKYYEDITIPYTDTRIQFEEMIRKWEKENEADRQE